MARDGFTPKRMAAVLGVQAHTMYLWLAKYPDVKLAYSEGMKLRKGGTPGGGETIQSYIFRRLPAEVQRTWKKISRIEKSLGTTTARCRERVEAILERRGKYVRQYVFLHALVNTNFDASAACRKANITKTTLDNWCNDPEFARLLEEMGWHQGNMIESALMKLVRKGDGPAIIFASKTFNAKRGYGSVMKVEHQGKVEHDHDHKHSLVDISKLNLTIPEKRKLLKAMQEAKRFEDEGPRIVEAEVVEESGEGDEV
jgi:hypothetical protein